MTKAISKVSACAQTPPEGLSVPAKGSAPGSIQTVCLARTSNIQGEENVKTVARTKIGIQCI